MTATPADAGPDPARSPVPPLWLAALVGALQGSLLWWLSRGGSGTTGSRQAALYALASVLPLSVSFLGAFVSRERWLNVGTLGVAGLSALIAAAQAGRGSLALASLFAVLGALLIQTLAAGAGKLRYTALFQFTVTGGLLALAGTLLMLLALALLQLCGALFAAVGFLQVQRAVGEAGVLSPVLAAAYSFGVAALRARAGWADTVARTLLTVVAWLLPPAALLAAAFLLALVPAGLADAQRLYEGLLSSYLYLTLTLTVLALTNAAYQDGHTFVLPTWLQGAIRVILVALPVFPLLALYGLARRTGEYGLTEERVLGLVLALVLLGVTLGYALYTRFTPWLQRLGRVNTASVLTVAALCLGLSVPGLRPLDLSVRDQSARLQRPALSDRERVSAVTYLAYQGGEAGKAALRRLLGQPALPQEARKLGRDALALEQWVFSQQHQQGAPEKWALRLIPLQAQDGPALNTAQLAAVKQKLIGRNDFSLYCQGQQPTCSPRYATYVSHTGLRALVFAREDLAQGVWFEFGGDKLTRLGAFARSYTPPPAPQKSASHKSPGGPLRGDTLHLPIVRVGNQVVFLSDQWE